MNGQRIRTHTPQRNTTGKHAWESGHRTRNWHLSKRGVPSSNRKRGGKEGRREGESGSRATLGIHTRTLNAGPTPAFPAMGLGRPENLHFWQAPSDANPVGPRTPLNHCYPELGVTKYYL